MRVFSLLVILAAIIGILASVVSIYIKRDINNNIVKSFETQEIYNISQLEKQGEDYYIKSNNADGFWQVPITIYPKIKNQDEITLVFQNTIINPMTNKKCLRYIKAKDKSYELQSFQDDNCIWKSNH